MKRAFFFLMVMMAFVLRPCYCQQLNETKSTDNASIKDPFSWDFGQVKEGSILKHNFVFRNETGNNLNIVSVDTSCGCTNSEVKKKHLAPGENTLIEVKFDTKGYWGTTQQFTYINTDALDNSVIKYIITAEVIK
jgi:hypothetical protein